MKKLLITIVTIWFTTNNFFSYAQVYSEKVEVHINTNFLITGETLYYSIHCLDTEKSTPSLLSKLAYVELIGENERPSLQTKISLIEGSGAGDFFLPSTLPTGNYTLIVYTKWMRNSQIENFFQKQVTIINPYVKPLTSETKTNADKTIVSTVSSKPETKNTTSQVHMVPDQRKYSHRQKVVIAIKNNDPANDCRISLNVHRYDKNTETVSPVSKPAQSQLKTESITFLPDLRGETISGIVKESASHKPVAQTNIYMSTVGSSNVFQISRTDSTGKFYFITKNILTQTGLRFQVDHGSESVPVEIILDDEFVNDYKKFKPMPLSLDTSVRRQIEQRNVYSQLENAYFIKKRDSILGSVREPFFGTPDKVYKLDDFTRFPSMEDIFREYMYEVVVTKREGKFAIRLINGNVNNAVRFLNTPLLLIDGLPIFDTEIFMNYNPLLIKTVSIVTKPYIYSGILFDGILSINTYTGNAKELPITSIQKDYTPWQRPKKYYSPVYNADESLARVPDYRVQLFWNPTIDLKPGQELVTEFYTSDMEGEFLIEAKGFNSKGEVVDIRDYIEVRK